MDLLIMSDQRSLANKDIVPENQDIAPVKDIFLEQGIRGHKRRARRQPRWMSQSHLHSTRPFYATGASCQT